MGKDNVSCRILWIVPMFAAIVLQLAATSAGAEGTWTAICIQTSPSPFPSPSCPNAPANFAPGTALLLTDGTVMIEGDIPLDSSTTWYKLAPDDTGHYDRGSITTVHASNCPHGSFASQVLQSGKVFIAGGEYGASGAPPGMFPGCATASQTDSGADTEIYDPVADTWTMIDPPVNLLDPNAISACNSTEKQSFGDMVSETLPDGTVLMAPLNPAHFGDTLIYDPKSNSWRLGGTLVGVCYQSESSWVKLPDGSILTVNSSQTTSQRYLPQGIYSTTGWVGEPNAPNMLYDNFVYEEGPAFLLPNGNAIFIGSTPYTDIYSPSGSANPGTWVPNAPCLPWIFSAGQSCGGGAPDAPGAMMPNGKVLLLLSQTPTSGKPVGVQFFEYDYTASGASVFTPVSPPLGFNASQTTDGNTMLVLPDGNVLLHSGNSLYIYHPDGAPLAQGRPSITNITFSSSQNGLFTFHLSGSVLTGISEGAAFGDDAQMASNYPLVRLTDAGGHVTYARTSNWSSTGVMVAGPESTEFTVPQGMLNTTTPYCLQVTVNGNASSCYSFPCNSGQSWNANAGKCEVIVATCTTSGTTAGCPAHSYCSEPGGYAGGPIDQCHCQQCSTVAQHICTGAQSTSGCPTGYFCTEPGFGISPDQCHCLQCSLKTGGGGCEGPKCPGTIQ